MDPLPFPHLQNQSETWRTWDGSNWERLATGKFGKVKMMASTLEDSPSLNRISIVSGNTNYSLRSQQNLDFLLFKLQAVADSENPGKPEHVMKGVRT